MQERNILDIERIKEEAKDAFASSIDDLNAAIESRTPLGVKEGAASKIRALYNKVYLKEAYTQKWYSLALYFVLFFMCYFSFKDLRTGGYIIALLPPAYALAAVWYFQAEFGLENFFNFYGNLHKKENAGILTKTFLEKVFSRKVEFVKDFEQIIKKVAIWSAINLFVFEVFFLISKSFVGLAFFGFLYYIVTLAAFTKKQA